jgi:hypothetical protein
MANAHTGSPDIFQDDWKDCLRAHYFHVIHEQDWKNERSLAAVLIQTGISQEETAIWRREAMHEIGIIEEEIAEVESKIEAAELPGDPQPEPVEIEPAEAYEQIEEVPAAEVVEVAELSEAAELPEAVVQAQMAFEETVDEATDSDPPTPPHVEPPSKPEQMSLF